jgi:hypothetical protein
VEVNRKSDQRKLTCRAAKSDGSPCSVRVREGSDFCFFHNPAKAKELRAAQALGGRGNRASSLPIDAPEFAAETVSDLVPLLVATINQVRRGELAPNAGTTICNLANSLIKALEVRDLRRLHDMEQSFPESETKDGLFDPNAEQGS